MNDAEARRVLGSALTDVGVVRGDTVYLAVDMGRMPLPSYSAGLDRAALRDREQRWCEHVFDVIREQVGSGGTLLAPTFTYAYAREGVPYVHEESPSETGPFTEFLRKHPEAVRSFHPLNSIAGVGPNAPLILENVGRAGYGVQSPFARLRAFGTKFLFLGAPLGISLTHAHHLEHMYGVNHMYHKLYSRSAFRDGKVDGGPWLCFVRYLGIGVEPRIANLEGRLRTRGLLRERSINGAPVQLAHIDDVEEVGYEMLRQNPCAFLQDPLEIDVASPGAAAEQQGAWPTVRFILS